MMPDPQVFTIAIAVREDDIDRQGQVNNVAFVRYVQDTAVAHWRAAAPPDLGRRAVGGQLGAVHRGLAGGRRAGAGDRPHGLGPPGCHNRSAPTG